MKVMTITLFLILFILILVSCQGDVTVVYLETNRVLFGSWIYANSTIPSDSTKISYKFSKPNKLVTSYYYLFTGLGDTTHMYWTYQTPYPGVISLKLDSLNGKLFYVHYPTPYDTLLYFFEGEELFLFSSTNTFRQLSGSTGKLENSGFYDCTYDERNKIFIHRLYVFAKDTVDYYFEINETSNSPNKWTDTYRYGYRRTSRYLYFDGPYSVRWKAYKFIGSKLLLSNDPIILKKE